MKHIICVMLMGMLCTIANAQDAPIDDTIRTDSTVRLIQHRDQLPR